MADRTDTADARHQSRHLGEGPAFAEFFEAAELGHVKAGIFDAAPIVEMEGYLGVPFDAGHRVDQNRFVDNVWHVLGSKARFRAQFRGTTLQEFAERNRR